MGGLRFNIFIVKTKSDLRELTNEEFKELSATDGWVYNDLTTLQDAFNDGHLKTNEFQIRFIYE